MYFFLTPSHVVSLTSHPPPQTFSSLCLQNLFFSKRVVGGKDVLSFLQAPFTTFPVEVSQSAQGLQCGTAWARVCILLQCGRSTALEWGGVGACSRYRPPPAARRHDPLSVTTSNTHLPQRCQLTSSLRVRTQTGQRLSGELSLSREEVRYLRTARGACGSVG
jgi:hypothetical protein